MAGGLTCALVVACGSDEPSANGPEQDAATDSGSRADAAPSPDAAANSDASTDDASTAIDAGETDADTTDSGVVPGTVYQGGAINQREELVCATLTACLPELQLGNALCHVGFSQARREGRAELRLTLDRGLGPIPASALTCLQEAAGDCTAARACLGISLQTPGDFNHHAGSCEGTVSVRAARALSPVVSIRQDCAALGWTCVSDGRCRPADMVAGGACQGNRYLDDGFVVSCKDSCAMADGQSRCVASTPCTLAGFEASCDGQELGMCSLSGIPYTVDCAGESPTGSASCDAPGAGCQVSDAETCGSTDSGVCVGNVIRRCASVLGASNPNVYDYFDCAAQGWQCEDSSLGARCIP